MNQLDTHTFPPGGWAFRQSQTGWAAPSPVSSTFDQTVVLIIQHRLKNPAIVAKHKLSTDPAVVGDELMKFNRLRLGIPEPQAPGAFFAPSRSLPERVVAVAENIKRAAQGTSVVLDWLASGGTPVAPELAEKRAAICVACPHNTPGDWYTVAPAEIIKAALDARSDLKLATTHDAELKSCAVCRCLLKLKVHTPLSFIVQHTKPEIMAEFPPSICWIARRDQ
jgi:hypothetical protein